MPRQIPSTAGPPCPSLAKAGRQYSRPELPSPPLEDHGPRRGLQIWGTQLVAGLGSHWARERRPFRQSTIKTQKPKILRRLLPLILWRRGLGRGGLQQSLPKSKIKNQKSKIQKGGLPKSFRDAKPKPQNSQMQTASGGRVPKSRMENNRVQRVRRPQTPFRQKSKIKKQKSTFQRPRPLLQSKIKIQKSKMPRRLPPLFLWRRGSGKGGPQSVFRKSRIKNQKSKMHRVPNPVTSATPIFLRCCPMAKGPLPIAKAAELPCTLPTIATCTAQRAPATCA